MDDNDSVEEKETCNLYQLLQTLETDSMNNNLNPIGQEDIANELLRDSLFRHRLPHSDKWVTLPNVENGPSRGDHLVTEDTTRVVRRMDDFLDELSEMSCEWHNLKYDLHKAVEKAEVERAKTHPEWIKQAQAAKTDFVSRLPDARKKD